MSWKTNAKFDMQGLRNTYAVPTLMPHFESGQEASVETGG